MRRARAARHGRVVAAVHRPGQTRDRFVARSGHRPVRYAEALDAGFTRASLQAAVDRGLLLRPRRGTICATPAEASDGHWSDHVADLRAALATVTPGSLASHDSAAVLHGIARPSAGWPDTVQLVLPGAANFTGPRLVLRVSPVPEHHRTFVGDIPATSIARTAVDLARGRRLPAALIPLDSAARILVARSTSTHGNALRHAVQVADHRELARAELAEALAACFGWAGTVPVREALPHVDPASESPLESRSRGWFIEAGLGALAPGSPIACAGTTYWADFCEPRRRVIGEADGWSKYGDTAADFRAALGRERRRQRELEADGWRFVRWSSTDRREAVLTRMSAALSRA